MNSPFPMPQGGMSPEHVAAKTRVITITKPAAGQSYTVNLSHDGSVKLDLSQIANEKIMIVKVPSGIPGAGEKAIIVFEDHSSITIDPFFFSGSWPINLTVDWGSQHDLTIAQFMANVPVTTDTSVIPAGGEQGEQSGQTFEPPSVDPLAPSNPLALLPPEELPNWQPTTILATTQNGDLTPTVSGTDLHVVVEEENLPGPTPISDSGKGNEDTSGIDDTDQAGPPFVDNVTLDAGGTLASLVTGGNLPLSFGIKSIEGTTVHDSSGADVTSLHETVTYHILNATPTSTEIEGVAGNRVIFTFTLNTDGTFSFHLNDQIDHPTGDGENALFLNLTEILNIQDADHEVVDFSTNPDAFLVEVLDDTPIAVAGDVNVGEVHEDGLSTGAGNLSDGNPDATSNISITITAAQLLNFVSIGADQPATFSLNSNISGAVHDSDGNAVTSKNVAVNFAFDSVSHDIIGYADEGGTVGQYDAGTDRVVFTLHDNGDGTFSFTLNDQIDHLPNVPADDDKQTMDISLAGVFDATDFDGDPVVLDAGKLVVTVEDDIPVAVAGDVNVGEVHEDGLSTAAGNLSDGNPETINNTSITIDSTQLQNFVNVGADEPAAFSLNANISGAVHNSDGNAITSKGVAVNFAYDSASHDIVGYADADGGTAGQYDAGTDRVVFTLHDNGDGTFTFALNDQIDHLPNVPANDDTQTMDINLAGVFEATDFDGDSVVLDAGKLIVTVEDDIPVAVAGAVNVGEVFEDGLSTAAGNLSDGNLEPGHDAISVSITSTQLQNFVSVGADEPATFGLNSDASGVVHNSDGQTVTSKGDAVNFAYDSASHDIVGYADADGGTAGQYDAGTDRVVFTLHDNGDGTFTFALNDQIDHLPNVPPNDDTQTTDISLAGMFEATDHDGDSVVLDAGKLIVTVEDDVPYFSEHTETLTVTELGESGIVSADLHFHVGADEPAHFDITPPSIDGVTAGDPVVDPQTGVITITATFNDGGDTFYVFTFDPSTGHYTFELDNLPPGETTLDTVDVAGAFAPVPQKDFGPFTFIADSGQNVNGSAQGVGVNDDNLEGGEHLTIKFDSPMTEVDVGVNFVGNKNNGIDIQWLATNTTTNQTETGIAHVDADGTIHIAANGVDLSQFDQLELTGLGNSNSEKVKITSLGGTEINDNPPVGPFEFQVTGSDFDGDKDSATITIDADLVAPVVTLADNASVDEDGLTAFAANVDSNADGNHTNEVDYGGSKTDTETISVNFSSDALTPANLTGAFHWQTTGLNGQLETTDGTSVVFGVESGTGDLVGYKGSLGGDEVIRLHITGATDNVGGTADYSYQVTLSEPLQHGSNPGEDQLTLNDVPFQIQGPTGTGSGHLDVFVGDDVPVAANESAQAAPGVKPTMNAVLVLDFSLSMNDVVPNTGGKTRLEIMKEAVHDFLTSNDVTFSQVTVYTFGVSASLLGQFNTASAADSAISALNTVTAGTNYAAVTSLIDGASADGYAQLSHPSADMTNLYFLSDGDPTGGTGLSGAQQTAWTNFLNDSTNDPDYPAFDHVYALGFSDINSTAFLSQIAPRAGSDTAEIVTDPIELPNTLTGTISAPALGNVLTNDSFGADGGHILSVKIGTTTYTYHADTNTITNDANANVISGAAATHVTATTPNGSSFTFYFTDDAGSGHSAGDYSYTADTVTPDIGTSESFHYVLTDGDGDTVGADLTVNIVAPDQAPVNTVPGAQTSVVQGVAYTFDAAHSNEISVSDVDANGGAEKVTLTATHGTITLSQETNLTVTGDGTGSVTLTGTLTDINAALNGMKYTSDANYSGSAQITITTDDQGHTGLGGPLSDTDTIGLTVGAPNHAPTANITNTTFAATEQTNLFLAGETGNNNGNGASLGSIADVDAGNGNMTITLSVTSGILTVTAGNSGISGANISGSGTSSVTITGTLAQINNLLGGVDTGGGDEGNIIYNANSDNPASPATLTLSVNDNGNTGIGGPLTGSDTATINVAAVDDAPVNSVPGSQSVNQDTPLTFSGARLISVSDVDANGGNEQVTLTVSHGTLSLSTISGLSFTVGDGSGDGTMTFTGSIADINAALNGMTYQGAAGYFGSDQLSITTNDLGHTGSGGPLSDTDTVNITVNHVNHQPSVDDIHIVSNNGGNQFTIPDSAFLAFASDPDGDTLSVSGVNDHNNATLNASHNNGQHTVSVDDDSTAGGTFDFTVTDSSLSDTATATYVQDTVGTLSGTSGKDIVVGDGNGSTIDGGGDSDVILANGGNDTIIADQNDYLIDGGSGTDTLQVNGNFSDTSDAQIVNIENVTLTTAATVDLSHQSEGLNVTGSSGNDTITTGSGADTIAGGNGADTIDVGADGSQDTVIFSSTSDYGDTIFNFDASGGTQDLISLRGSLNSLFDDAGSANGTLTWDTNGGGVNLGNSSGNVEALMTTAGSGVDITDAGDVAAAFNSAFAITAATGNDALLVINNSSSNEATVWQFTQSNNGGEISAGELTLIATVHTNAALTSGNFDLHT